MEDEKVHIWVGAVACNKKAYWLPDSKENDFNPDRCDVSYFCVASYTNWAAIEPNNARGNEHCVQLFHDSFKWNDHPCKFEQCSLCQADEI